MYKQIKHIFFIIVHGENESRIIYLAKQTQKQKQKQKQNWTSFKLSVPYEKDITIDPRPNNSR